MRDCIYMKMYAIMRACVFACVVCVLCGVCVLLLFYRSHLVNVLRSFKARLLLKPLDLTSFGEIDFLVFFATN